MRELKVWGSHLEKNKIKQYTKFFAGFFWLVPGKWTDLVGFAGWGVPGYICLFRGANAKLLGHSTERDRDFHSQPSSPGLSSRHGHPGCAWRQSDHFPRSGRRLECILPDSLFRLIRWLFFMLFVEST